jgi:HAMP domain-containing protein
MTGTTRPSTNEMAVQQSTPSILTRLPGTRLLNNLNIGRKLTVGFGILVVLTLLVGSFSALGSASATQTIDQTGDIRVPTALTSTRAQATLLKMLGDVHVYLALGDPEYRARYDQDSREFTENLAELRKMAPNLSGLNEYRLQKLEEAFAQWSTLPEQLFELRNDQLEREPAYRILATEGIQRGGTLLIELNTLIEAQGRREPTVDNIALLADMAKFQGSFASMLSGLRGYVTTRNRIFKGEYEANLAVNNFAWERLEGQGNKLTPTQRASLTTIAESREGFLELPDQMFEALESERWREDLYLFKTEAVPLADTMLGLLGELTTDQQERLRNDLDQGRQGLAVANQQTQLAGVAAVVLGILLALIFRENIAGPVRRLTGVAEQIRGGDLEAKARIESRDEIGTLATTFNNMTDQLRRTLFQVRREKKRADDLLHVVIPIGVELSSEKDFNRLLETMLVEAKTFCRANAGILYLRDSERLKYVIVRNDAMGLTMGGTSGQAITYAPIPLYNSNGEPQQRNVAAYVALKGTAVNIANADTAQEFDLSDSEGINMAGDGTATSLLTIPLKNNLNEVLGVLQLVNAHDSETSQIIPFDANLQQMMESFSSLAVAALEAYIREQSLKQQIQQLRIEIDEAKQQKQVSEIVETEFFNDLQSRARAMRTRGRRKERDASGGAEA